MEITIKAFGNIADKVGRDAWKWEGMETEGIKDLAVLRKKLEQDFPQLRGAPYLIAVNRRIATAETPLADQAEVALLPPFSGG